MNRTVVSSVSDRERPASNASTGKSEASANTSAASANASVATSAAGALKTQKSMPSGKSSDVSNATQTSHEAVPSTMTPSAHEPSNGSAATSVAGALKTQKSTPSGKSSDASNATQTSHAAAPCTTTPSAREPSNGSVAAPASGNAPTTRNSTPSGESSDAANATPASGTTSSKHEAKKGSVAKSALGGAAPTNKSSSGKPNNAATKSDAAKTMSSHNFSNESSIAASAPGDVAPTRKKLHRKKGTGTHIGSITISAGTSTSSTTATSASADAAPAHERSPTKQENAYMPLPTAPNASKNGSVATMPASGGDTSARTAATSKAEAFANASDTNLTSREATPRNATSPSTQEASIKGLVGKSAAKHLAPTNTFPNVSIVVASKASSKVQQVQPLQDRGFAGISASGDAASTSIKSDLAPLPLRFRGTVQGKIVITVSDPSKFSAFAGTSIALQEAISEVGAVPQQCVQIKTATGVSSLTALTHAEFVDSGPLEVSFSIDLTCAGDAGKDPRKIEQAFSEENTAVIQAEVMMHLKQHQQPQLVRSIAVMPPKIESVQQPASSGFPANSSTANSSASASSNISSSTSALPRSGAGPRVVSLSAAIVVAATIAVIGIGSRVE